MPTVRKWLVQLFQTFPLTSQAQQLLAHEQDLLIPESDMEDMEVTLAESDVMEITPTPGISDSAVMKNIQLACKWVQENQHHFAGKIELPKVYSYGVIRRKTKPDSTYTQTSSALSTSKKKCNRTLYKQLTSECQGNKETPQNFLMRVLDLRQKILFASQEAESGLKYDPALVQSMFLHAVLTGLLSDSIKVDMQPFLLDTKTTDETLLEKLNIACANEVERQKKRKTSVQHATTIVHAVQSNGETTDKKLCAVQSVPKSSSNVLTELKELRTDVASLKTLSAEIAHIRESLQRPAFNSPQYPVPALGLPEKEMVQYQVQPYWSSPTTNQMRVNTQFQPQYIAPTILCTLYSFPSKKVLQLSTARNRGQMHALF
ncbi:hypothetical protein QQF64_020456 [Cirrhinus molitorella]|uniref:Uncharacterized protein n=1 Tax=Cirrhinus molitorella TaxID=172907 RepID=A0ABR3LBK4_9TELE